MTNTPYKKVYENGILQNPITKEKPFLSGVSQRPFNRNKMRLQINPLSMLSKNPEEKPKYDTFKRTARGKWNRIN